MSEYIKWNIMLYSLYANFEAGDPNLHLDLFMISMLLLEEEQSAHLAGINSSTGGHFFD
jgi:hypothetical protein